MMEVNPEARLFIVDDEIANICLLQNVLERLGFKIIESTTDSREAIARIEKFQPDLIVLDLNMPHPDGFAIMQQLRKIVPRDTYLPVLVITANISADTKRKALAAGAADLLTKPFQTAEVFMRIRNLLQSRFLHRQLEGQNQALETKVAGRTRELREMQQQIIVQERLRAFGEMAGGIVHDFNNALMAVTGYSEILLQDDETLNDREKTRKFLTVINNAGQDASRVISRLRDFYRPREMTDVFSRVDLNEIIEQAVPLTQPKWKGEALAGGRAISVVLDLAKLPPISGNVQELREIPASLIFNAVDAMPAGGTITLRSGRDGSDVLFEVTDTGTGMTEEVRARCLEPFFTTKNEKSTGLGLSTVFGIVKRHEGSVQIESEPGRGTTFRVRIPALVEPSVADAKEPSGMDRSLRVLVVDDEPVSRSVLEGYLTRDGHRVVTATSGKEAIVCSATEEFDLLITDHAMPDMNGTQLAALFRAKRKGHPVILVTGFAPGGMGRDENSADVNLVVRKPVPRRELRRALASVMGA